MSSTFGGIYRAGDALNAARYGLEVTGQNIANASTPGYTRQASRQVAVGTAVGVPTIHTGMQPTGGVRIAGTDRLADPVLNARARTEHGRSAVADTTASRLTDLENIFREPSDNGLADRLSDYWNAWGDVANDPGEQVQREMLLNAASSVVTTLRTMDSAIDNVMATAAGSLNAQITEANGAAAELADLNKSIVIGTASGTNVNSLLDRRDQLLDVLSTTVGAVGTIHANGTASVSLGGQDLVTAVEPGTPSTAAVLSIDSSYQVSIDDGGGVIPVALTSGAAAAEHTALTVTIPHYRDRLDGVANQLTSSVNALQANGYDLDGAAGTNMFSGSTAQDIDIAAGFTWRDVAASSTPGGGIDGGNALIASDGAAGANSGDSHYGALIGDLGLASAAAKQAQTTQASITASVDTLQAATSGVSFDEEVNNMLTFQTAFQAAARVLTTMDSMLDTLINRTGLVGLR